MMPTCVAAMIVGLAGSCGASTANVVSAAQDGPPPVQATVAPITPPFRFDISLDQRTIPVVVAELTRSLELDDDQAEEIEERLRAWRGRFVDAEAAVRAEVLTQMEEGASLAMRLAHGLNLISEEDVEARQAWLAGEAVEIRAQIEEITLAIRTVHSRRQEGGDVLRAELCEEIAGLLDSTVDDLCWRIELAMLRPRLIPPDQARFPDFGRFMELRAWLPHSATWYPPLAHLFSDDAEGVPEWTEEDLDRIDDARAEIAAMLVDYDRLAHQFLLEWVRSSRTVRPSRGGTLHRQYWGWFEPLLDRVAEQCGQAMGDEVRTEFLRATYRYFAPALTGPWRADLACRALEERRTEVDPELSEAIAMSIDAYRAERERRIETAIPIGRRATVRYGTLYGDETPMVQYRQAQEGLRELSIRQMQEFKSLLAHHPSTASVWSAIERDVMAWSEPINDPGLRDWDACRW